MKACPSNSGTHERPASAHRAHSFHQQCCFPSPLFILGAYLSVSVLVRIKRHSLKINLVQNTYIHTDTYFTNVKIEIQRSFHNLHKTQFCWVYNTSLLTLILMISVFLFYVCIKKVSFHICLLSQGQGDKSFCICHGQLTNVFAKLHIKTIKMGAMRLPLQDDAFPCSGAPWLLRASIAGLFPVTLLQQRHVDKHGKLWLSSKNGFLKILKPLFFSD